MTAILWAVWAFLAKFVLPIFSAWEIRDVNAIRNRFSMGDLLRLSSFGLIIGSFYWLILSRVTSGIPMFATWFMMEAIALAALCVLLYQNGKPAAP